MSSQREGVGDRGQWDTVTSADYTLYVQQRNTAVVYNQRLPAVSVNLPVVCQLSLPVGQLVSVANNDSTQT